MKKNMTQFNIMFLFLLVVIKGFPQEFITIKEYHENFSLRSFAFGKFQYFARLSYNNQTIYVENLNDSGKIVHVFSKENEGVKYLSFDDSEAFLASASYSGEINLWAMDQKKLIQTYKLHEGAVNKVGFVPNSKLMVSVGNDGKIMIVRTGEKDAVPIMLGSHSGIVRSFDITRNGKFLITIGNDKKIIVWNLDTYQKNMESPVFNNILTAVRLINNDKKIVVGDINGNISVLNLEELKITNSIKIHSNIISQIESNSHNEIITSSFDGNIKKIDLNNNKEHVILINKNYILQLSLYCKNKIAFSDVKGHLKLIQLLN